MALLIVAFLLILAIAFSVVLLMLRVPADVRAVEERLASLEPALSLRDPQQGSRFFKEKQGAAEGAPALFGRLKLIQALQRLVYQATGGRSIGSTLLAVCGAALLAMAVTLLISDTPPIAAVAGILCGTLPLVRLYRIRQKRLRAFEQALPDCIDMCARALRAGHSLIAAIGMVAEDAPEPAKTEFADIFRKQNYGLPLRDAFAEMMERIPSADLRVFVTGILVQKDTGGNLTEIFDRIVNVIRERMRIQGEIRVHTTQGRLTGWILTLLPVALLIIINLINPGYSKPLFSDPTGKKLLYAGLVLLLTGGVVIRRIVNGIEV